MKEEKKGEEKREKKERERETRENKGKSTASTTLNEKHVFFWVSAFPVAAG